MNAQKMCPVAIRAFQYCRQITNTQKLVKVDSRVTFAKVSVTFGLAWAFIWPAKKSQATQTETKVNVIEGILKKGDDFFENGHYEECYDVLKEANDLEEKNVEILWRMARVLYNISKQPKCNKDEKKKIITEAFLIISNQLQDCSNHYAVQKWYALLLDAKSSQEGVSARIKQLENVKKHMDEEKNVEILWRMARVLYNISKQPKCNKDEKKKIITEAFLIISNQLQDCSNHYAVQKWYALLLDAKSSQEGVSARIKQLENVKKHMDLAVTLNPDDATTLFMLGEWCYQITEMPWHQRKIAEVLFATPPNSTYEDALEYFLRAEAAQPRFYSLNLLRLGSCYLKLEKEDQAKYYLKLAASYPAKSNDDHLANKEAAELLKTMK